MSILTTYTLKYLRLNKRRTGVTILGVVLSSALICGVLLLDERSLDEARLKEIVATLGLADRVRHLPNQLSGGQQQRVSIGRALINNPALVLADEPTGNLDSANSKEIIALLKLSNKRYHQTLIVVTHDRDIALQADRIISFGDGRIVRDEAVRG